MRRRFPVRFDAQINFSSKLATKYVPGKECVALAVDKRFASGPQMVHVSPRRVLALHSKLLVGLVGLDGDVQSIAQELSAHVASKANRESGGLTVPSAEVDEDSTRRKQRRISPRAMASLTSHVLYSKRSAPFYCEPLIVGLESESNQNNPVSTYVGGDFNAHTKGEKYRPFICSMDMLGAKMVSGSFACTGAASKSMYGTAEAMWRPNMNPEELVRVCGRAFLSALERDCLSGYGAVIYLITDDGIMEYDLVSRSD